MYYMNACVCCVQICIYVCNIDWGLESSFASENGKVCPALIL